MDEPLPPTTDEIAELVARKCDATYTCLDYGSEEEVAELIEECKSGDEGDEGLYLVLSEERSPDCADVWLVYAFHDCRASLGCSDYMTDPESPGNPCHEELMAAYDAMCLIY